MRRLKSALVLGILAVCSACSEENLGPTPVSPSITATAYSGIVVTNTNDAGLGSLRQAFIDANAAAATIVFNIPTSDPGFDGSVFTIQPLSALPELRSGISVDGTTQTAFTGNTNPHGPEVVLNGRFVAVGSGILISGDDGGVKGLVINGFANGAGVALSRLPFDPTPSRNRIVENYLGTDPAGTLAVPNNVGISMGGFGTPGAEARDNVVQENLIAGNAGGGISTCDIKGTQFVNNRIGTDRTGVNNLGNGAEGIAMFCTGALENRFGDNIIAFNVGDGLRSVPDFRFGNFHHENLIRGNSIFMNAGLGINLLPPPFGFVDGVTANDVCDADGVGSNFLQNFPVLTSAGSNGVSTTISGTLNSAPGQSFAVELFANDAADPSGFGEGQTPLGVVNVNTDAACLGNLNVVFPVGVAAGKLITATATDAMGNTSEFSQAIEVVSLVASVAIDIKPGSDPNSINCGLATVTVPVAILTTDDFDATIVNHTTVAFGPNGATEIHRNRKGIARHEEDVDVDGDTDLVLHFRFGDTGLVCGDTEATLTGETFGGQAIEGSDAVRMADGTAP